MRQFFRIFILLFISCPFYSFAEQEQIHEIYTESTGNNPYEAKVKALDKAEYRAFIILADKLMFRDEALKNVSREDLKSLFSGVNIRNEVTRAYLSGSSYNAVISFTFLQSKFNEVISKYCSPPYKEKILEAVVIPVFKINHVETIEKDKMGWISSWKSQEQNFFQNRLLVYEHSNGNAEKINTKTIHNMMYEDYLISLPYKFFHKVIVPIGEFYTDKQSGNSFFRVKYIINSISGRTEEIKDYKLEGNSINLPKFLSSIVEEFLQNYGKARNPEYASVLEETGLEVELVKPEEKDPSYMFLVEVNYGDEERDVESRLHKIKEIDRFDLDMNYKQGHRVRIYTKIDMLELTAKLYNVGLSFYYNKDKMPVIILK